MWQTKDIISQSGQLYWCSKVTRYFKQKKRTWKLIIKKKFQSVSRKVCTEFASICQGIGLFNFIASSWNTKRKWVPFWNVYFVHNHYSDNSGNGGHKIEFGSNRSSPDTINGRICKPHFSLPEWVVINWMFCNKKKILFQIYSQQDIPRMRRLSLTK